MSTHVPEFQSLYNLLHYLVLAKVASSSKKVNKNEKNWLGTCTFDASKNLNSKSNIIFQIA